MTPIEDYYAKYDEAAKNPELLETFWSMWGDTREKACSNMRHYDQFQEVGYTDEPIFDEYGWIKNEVPQDKIEKVRLFGEEPVVSSVECLQLPNGKWVSGCHWMLSITGIFCGCSIWGKQYDSRIEALMSEMRHVAEVIKKSSAQADKARLSDVVRAMDDLRQLSLF